VSCSHSISSVLRSDYHTFKIPDDPTFNWDDYKRVEYHIVYANKHDGRQKARLVANPTSLKETPEKEEVCDHLSNSICLPCSDKYFKAAAEKCYMIPGTGRKCTILYCPYRCCKALFVELLADGLTLLRTPVYIPKGAKWNTKYVDKNRYSLPTAIAQYVTVEVAVVAQVNHADVDELMDSSESSSGSNSRDSTYQPDESEGESETETAMADIPQEITTTVVVRRHDGEPDGTHDDPVIID